MEDSVLKQLKSILLEDERGKQEKFKVELDIIREQLKDIEPQIADKIELRIKEDFEKVSGLVITKTVQTEILQSKDMMLEAVYPLLGKLIRKYVQVELEKLSENIDKQIDKTFSLKNIRQQFIALWEGVSAKDLILKDLNPLVIEEVYVIDQESGILTGKYSRGSTIDQDLIAGMLTAIKAFIEDAFQQKTGTLDMIEYGTFKIILENSHKFYIAAIVSGTMNAQLKAQIMDYMQVFAQNHLKKSFDELSEEEISSQLKRYFDDFNTTSITITERKKNSFTINNFFDDFKSKSKSKYATDKQKDNFNWKFWSR